MRCFDGGFFVLSIKSPDMVQELKKYKVLIPEMYAVQVMKEITERRSHIVKTIQEARSKHLYVGVIFTASNMHGFKEWLNDTTCGQGELTPIENEDV